MKRDIEIAPSILSADFADLSSVIKELKKTDIKRIHLDVMDGHFVPNITFGPPLVKSLRKKTDLLLESHLMIFNPSKFIKSFSDSGSDIIIIHKETTENPEELISYIRELGRSPGISINPETEWEDIKEYLEHVDLVLIMTVNPGFGGQKFMGEVLDKVKALKDYIDKNNINVDIEVDGGINKNTIKEAYNAGINIFVAGSSIFGKPNIVNAIKELKEKICHCEEA